MIAIGESVRIIRELQELSQNKLSAMIGIPQSTLSAVEHDKINLGLDTSVILYCGAIGGKSEWCKFAEDIEISIYHQLNIIPTPAVIDDHFKVLDYRCGYDEFDRKLMVTYKNMGWLIITTGDLFTVMGS